MSVIRVDYGLKAFGRQLPDTGYAVLSPRGRAKKVVVASYPGSAVAVTADGTKVTGEGIQMVAGDGSTSMYLLDAQGQRGEEISSGEVTTGKRFGGRWRFSEQPDSSK